MLLGQATDIFLFVLLQVGALAGDLDDFLFLVLDDVLKALDSLLVLGGLGLLASLECLDLLIELEYLGVRTSFKVS